MSETGQIILGIIFLVGVYMLTRFLVVWRMKRTSAFIIKDLNKREAFDPPSAAVLPYASKNFFKIGLRDYRPKALEGLVQSDIVARTADGRFYLKVSREELRRRTGLSL